MKRRDLLKAALLAASYPASAGLVLRGSGGAASCSGIYGNNAAQNSNQGGASNLAILSRVTIDCDSPASYSLNVRGKNDYSEQYILVIYANSGGEPGSLVEASSAQATPNDEDDATFSVSFTASLSAGDYWIGIIAGHHAIGIYDTASTGGTTRQVTLASFAAPATWNTSTDTDRTWNMAFWLDFG